MYLPEANRDNGGFSPAVATTIQSKTLGPVQLMHLKAPAPRDEPAAGYLDPGDSLVWAFITGGAIISKRASTDLENSAGNMNMNHMPRLTGFQMTPDFRSLSIRMDRSALALTAAEIDAISKTVFPLQEGVPMMLGSMASQVMKMEGDLGPASGAAFAQSIVDLTLAFVDDFLGKRTAPETIRRNLVAEARRHVELYSVSPSYTSTSVAAALQVSTRTLQKAFEPESLTLTQTILECRLIRARSLLERDGRVGIESVCLRSGFVSASSFSRAFRARFDLSPRDWRKRHLAS